MTFRPPAVGPVPATPLASLRWVRVGSTSGPKILAVRGALHAFAPDARVEGVEVDSGVPEQPLGFEEIVRGARNRAERASHDAELGVGIEDGLVALPGGGSGETAHHVNVGCAAVTDGTRYALGFSSAFAYPPGCTAPAVRDRDPIGPVFDRFWESRHGEAAPRPSGGSVGNIGKLSLGVLTRSEYARHAVLCALLPFLHPDLYGGDAS